MLILTLRTDKPASEVGLYDDNEQLVYKVWEAHRKLAETLSDKIANILHSNEKEFSDIEGIVVYRGPGSFTGLRIGIAVTNALAYSLDVPIVGETNDWIEHGISRLLQGENDKTVLPEYGQDVHVTQQKK